MADTPTTPAATPAPSPSISTAATGVEHQAERDVKHGLSHLESEAVTYFVDIPEAAVKRMLAWVAGKL